MCSRVGAQLINIFKKKKQKTCFKTILSILLAGHNVQMFKKTNDFFPHGFQVLLTYSTNNKKKIWCCILNQYSSWQRLWYWLAELLSFQLKIQSLSYFSSPLYKVGGRVRTRVRVRTQERRNWNTNKSSLSKKSPTLLTIRGPHL